MYLTTQTSYYVLTSPIYASSFSPQAFTVWQFPPPDSITEEYLQRFHFGQGHDSADILDTCHEYWQDWGAFGGPLYPRYQTLFPWDCTEAFWRYPTRCGSGCNLTKHIWAFPFDPSSFISHQLTRDRCLYPSTDIPEDKQWMQSRLQLLSASVALCRGAAAMARTPAFHAATAWLHSPAGAWRRDQYPALRRVKHGGIHRAQPFSHYFDAGWGERYFLAEWALWSREDQVRRYEEIREERMRMGDVEESDGEGRWWGRFYIGDGSSSTNRKERKEEKRDGGDGGGDGGAWALFAGVEGPADSRVLDRRRGGGNQSQGTLMNVALMVMEFNADCGFTAGDTAGGGRGGDSGELAEVRRVR
ncbi:hypothetical protein C8A03DRAFT_37449 [Achaetomium macrosporum]|uniref:Uncharacterized protein n=1 Tax=Achaetomium macrosporum TaxID=79813 RepID=A0AAN7C3P4_9PEZI|nr:hypothetical protein C8A03DRAFT_37449 [Achaetomium macrosporum]